MGVGAGYFGVVRALISSRRGYTALIMITYRRHRLHSNPVALKVAEQRRVYVGGDLTSANKKQLDLWPHTVNNSQIARRNVDRFCNMPQECERTEDDNAPAHANAVYEEAMPVVPLNDRCTCRDANHIRKPIHSMGSFANVV